MPNDEKAREVALRLARTFLEKGQFTAAESTRSGGGGGALPAALSGVSSFASFDDGFAGLEIQSVGASRIKRDEEEVSAVHVYATKGSQRLFKEIPEALDGVPIVATRMGRMNVRPEKASSSTNSGSTFVLDSGEIACGSSCSPTNARLSGTLGALIEIQGEMYVLSNNHVIGGCNHTAPGMPILAPSTMDSGPGRVSPKAIAELTSLVELRSGAPAHVPLATVDAAIARVLDRNLLSSWQGSQDAGFDTPDAVVDPELGARVKKFGRTTGLSLGTIESKVAPFALPYKANEFAGNVWFQDVWIVRADHGHPFALGGDSGSLVVLEDGSASVGLVFAANPSGEYGWMCSLNDTLRLLGNATIVHGHNVPQ